MYQMIYKFMCMAYSAMLRNLLVNAINDPDSDVDEFVVGLFDKLFDYGGD